MRVEKLRDLIARLHARPRRRLTLLVGVDGPAGAGKTAFLGQARGGRVAIVDEVLGQGAPVISGPAGSYVPATAGAVGRVLAGQRVALDHGEYLEGVNAVAAAVPGGLVWVAGFAARLSRERLTEVADLLERLCV